MCWECHRAYAAEVRADQRTSSGLVRGIIVGLVIVVGALSAGAPFFVSIAVVPIAMGFGSYASRRHRRAWLHAAGPTLPEARLLASPRAPSSDTDR